MKADYTHISMILDRTGSMETIRGDTIGGFNAFLNAQNASREFRKDQIGKMINEKREKSAWQFVFLSADLEAIGDALQSGIHAHSVLAHDKDQRGVGAAWASLSRSVADYRAARKEDVSFTDEDREQQENEKKRK